MLALKTLRLFSFLAILGIILFVTFYIVFVNKVINLHVIDVQEEISKKLLSGTVYIERLEHLNSICSHLNRSKVEDFNILKENHVLLDHILVDLKHKLLYCYVPKVACTNWKRIFMILSGAANTTDVLSIPAHLAHSRNFFLTLNNFSLVDVEYLLNTYTKFLFVRHPFERILSAFRNKLEQNYIRSKYFQTRIGRYIVKKYRMKPKNDSLLSGNDVTFDEFTAYLSKSESEVFNEHWMPVTQLCEPCRIKYDFVGKYETLLSDSSFILKSIGIENIRFPYNVKAATTSDELKKYFSVLSVSRIKDLYSIYENDFKLFQYSLQELLGYEVG